MSSDERTQGGLSVKTLLIAAAASATAAVVIPLLWRPGTVFAAAMTPIVVALVSETLRRPVESVSAVRVRRTARGTAILDPPPAEPFDPLARPSEEDLAVLPERTSAPRVEHRRPPLTGRQWKLALATGLIAFAGVAAAFTATELVAGEPVTADRGRTTFFGGSRSQAGSRDQSPERREQSPTAEQTTKPGSTATPAVTASPTPTATPAQTPTTSPTPPPATPAPTP